MESMVQQFLKDNGSQDELVVVFYAEWFLPSLKVKAKWENTIGEDVPVVVVNVDEAIELVEELKLMGVPAVYRFTNGEITERQLLK